jgi:High potential iron-sulfur protein
MRYSPVPYGHDGKIVMNPFESRLSRTTFIRGALVLPALAGVLSASAPADDKLQQSAVRYRAKPNDGKQCSKCKMFLPGNPISANGTCKIVGGVISPNGFCNAYNAK